MRPGNFPAHHLFTKRADHTHAIPSKRGKAGRRVGGSSSFASATRGYTSKTCNPFSISDTMLTGSVRINRSRSFPAA